MSWKDIGPSSPEPKLPKRVAEEREEVDMDKFSHMAAELIKQPADKEGLKHKLMDALVMLCAGGKGERLLQRDRNARNVLLVNGHHLWLVALAGEGGVLDAPDRMLDVPPADSVLLQRHRLWRTRAAEREHLGWQAVEDLLHLWVGAHAGDQLDAQLTLAVL